MLKSIKHIERTSHYLFREVAECFKHVKHWRTVKRWVEYGVELDNGERVKLKSVRDSFQYVRGCDLLEFIQATKDAKEFNEHRIAFQLQREELKRRGVKDYVQK